MKKYVMKSAIKVVLGAMCLGIGCNIVSPVVSYAETVKTVQNVDLTKVIDKYISVKNGRFSVDNEIKLRQEIYEKQEFIKEIDDKNNVDSIINKLKERISDLNRNAELNLITINKSKKITNNIPQLRVAGQSTSHHWWGARHVFYWDDAARDYAYEVRMLAHANAGAAVLAGAIFSGVGGVPNGLSAVYGYMIADSVDYNANKSGDGVILDVNWWLTFSCYPR